jgi:hypothetical protein
VGVAATRKAIAITLDGKAANVANLSPGTTTAISTCL